MTYMAVNQCCVFTNNLRFLKLFIPFSIIERFCKQMTHCLNASFVFDKQMRQEFVQVYSKINHSYCDKNSY